MTRNLSIRKMLVTSFIVFSVYLLGTTYTLNTVYAQEYPSGTTVTTVTVTDVNTGTVLDKYTVNAAITEAQEDPDGAETITTTFDIRNNSEITPFTNSSTNDTFEGWKGTVRITYTNDGTFACLEEVYGRWEQLSGSVSRGNSSLTYGQDLATNPDNGRIDMTNLNGVQAETGFTPGKYGYNLGHKVGANLYAVLGTKAYTVECNVYL